MNEAFWEIPPTFRPDGKLLHGGKPSALRLAMIREAIAEGRQRAPRCGRVLGEGRVCLAIVPESGMRCRVHGGGEHAYRLPVTPAQQARARANRLRSIWRRAAPWPWYPGSTLALPEQHEGGWREIMDTLLGRQPRPPAVEDWSAWMYVGMVLERRPGRLARKAGLPGTERGFIELMRTEGRRRIRSAGPPPSQAQVDQLLEMEQLLVVLGRRWRRSLDLDHLRELARSAI
jgi:hypothetical protein